MSRFAWPCRAHRNPLVYCCESGNQIINVVALLLLFYCIIHGPPGSVLLVAVTAQQQPCCDLSPLCLPQTVLLCACLCLGAVYVPGMCAWRVGFHNVSRQQQHRSGSSTTPAVFPISCLCSSSQGVRVCGWFTTGDRTTATCSRPMQQPRTSLLVYSSSTAAAAVQRQPCFQSPAFVPVVTGYVCG